MMFSRDILTCQNIPDDRMLPAREWLKSISISTHLTLGMLLRLILIAYGQHQDETMEVLYTDVDYKVFTDAARHVTEGGSPYERHTYRYSPLLAWLMVPNIVWSPNLGKLIFSSVLSLLAVRLPVAVQSSR